MTGLSHALLFSVLLSTSFVSVFFPTPKNTPVKEDLSDNLEIVEKAEECAPIEEVIPTPEKIYLNYSSDSVTVYNKKESKIETLPLEEYLVGVLLAEVPSWYDTEALKACAVASRTYTLYKKNASAHANGADVCTDSSHCQAYYSLSDAVSAWSEKSAVSAEEKIREALRETSGEILTYDNSPILAVYHASSYLSTRSSKEVFGTDVEYLQSVSVLHENENNTNRSTKDFTKNEMAQILFDNGYLGRLNENFELSDVWEGNKCIGIEIAADTVTRTVSALKVRSLFSLKSSNFKISESDTGYSFDVYGFGHGVGLSQNGANVLAENGFSYAEILSLYYKGSILSILKNNE